MARINIEDSLWSDPRFLRLCIALGDEMKAVGAVVLGWRTAQKFWCPERLPIPHSDFEAAGLPQALVTVGLADETELGIRMRGSEEHFHWWFERREAGQRGGQASAAKRSSSSGKLRSSRAQANSSKSKQKQPSISISSSISSSNSELNTLPIPTDSAQTMNPVTYYCDLWKARNGRSPDIRGKEVGQITGLVKDVGLHRTLEIIKAYFSMPDPLFIRRGYDVGTMIMSLAAITQFEANGKIVTREFVKQVESQVDKIQNTKRRKSVEELELERAQMLAEAQGSLSIGGKA